MGRPRKIEHPGLDKMLRIILTMKKRPSQRKKIFDKWVEQDLRATFKREPTVAEIEETVKWFQERKFEDPNFIFRFSESLKDFVPAYHKDNLIKKARNAAEKRWSRENREKRAKNIVKKS
jgi:hypothetical protein